MEKDVVDKLEKVKRMLAVGDALRSLLTELKDVDTDTFCLHCGVEALALEGEVNTCCHCGMAQSSEDMIVLDDELLATSSRLRRNL